MGWRAIAQQEDKHIDRHLCRYERGLWNKTEKGYDPGNAKCSGLTKSLKKFQNYVYGVRFVVETVAKIFIHQLNLPANDQPGALIIHQIASTQLFNFNVKHLLRPLNAGPDGLSHRP